jgi:hypothetical protein
LPTPHGFDAGPQGHRNSGADVGLSPPVAEPAAPAANVADGTGSSGAAGNETTVKGNATVTVKLQGAPAGTRTSATADGDLFASSGPPRIENSAVGNGLSP